MLSNDKYGFGQLARNAGEVIGAFGGLQVERAPIWERMFRKNTYKGHVELTNLGDIESWLRDLRSPKWPENILPPIDREMAALGETLYSGKAGCIGCHELVAPEEEGKLYNARLIDIDDVKTDHMMAKNAVDHEAYTYLLEGTREAIIYGDKFGEKTAAIDFASNGTFGLLLKEPGVAISAAWNSRHIEQNPSSDELRSLPKTEAESEAFITQRIEAYVDERTAKSWPGCAVSYTHLTLPTTSRV